MRTTPAKLVLLIGALCMSALPVSAASPPNGFRAITLGMSLDSVKESLRADSNFRYRGDPDVSLVPRTSQSVIECEGAGYVRRAYFQFEKDKLFIMILILDPSRIDHYALFSSLVRKYGEPSSLSPRESAWEFESVRLTLERPLTVKYVERRTFAALVDSGTARADLEQMSRDSFIDQF
jgi:hypothetical protein